MTTPIEKLDHLIDLLEADEEHISIKETVYLWAMKSAREQLLKKPVAWAERVNEDLRREHGFSETWSVREACLEKDCPIPSSYSKEFKPLYDK